MLLLEHGLLVGNAFEASESLAVLRPVKSRPTTKTSRRTRRLHLNNLSQLSWTWFCGLCVGTALPRRRLESVLIWSAVLEFLELWCAGLPLGSDGNLPVRVPTKSHTAAR